MGVSRVTPLLPGLRRSGAITVAVTAGLALAAGAGAALAQPVPPVESRFVVVARADALALEYVNTAAPVAQDGQIFYGTPSTAQSVLDSVGRSQAFASAPFPGDLGAGSLSNANGVLAGFGAPGVVPAYPFLVSSTYPGTPSDSQEQGAYQVRAQSEEHRSASNARTGLVSGDFVTALTARASSESALDPATGTLRAVADSRLDALRITDALQIGRSTAHARIVASPGTSPVKESSFTVGSIVVNGTEFGWTDDGFVAGDDADPPPDPAAVFAPLAPTGITVEVLPATETETSIESAGLRITWKQSFPDGRFQRLVFLLGRVSTSIDGAAAPALPDVVAPVGGAAPVAGEPVPASAAEVPPAASAPPATAQAAPEAAPRPGPAALDVAVPVAPAPRREPAAAPPPPLEVAAPVRVEHPRLDGGASALFAALAAVALVMLVGTGLLGTPVRGAPVGSVLRLPGR